MANVMKAYIHQARFLQQSLELTQEIARPDRCTNLRGKDKPVFFPLGTAL
jgi:hypothetical protein